MGQLVLAAAGRAAVGAVQAFAGAAIARAFDTRRFEGRRLAELRIQGSTEGAGLPIVYGRARVAGQVIWAARFKETQRTSGGKGGPRTTTYGYSLSFAVALAEGPIEGIGRVWADGRPFDLGSATWRLHLGAEDQAPDPLILAIEGADGAPAYRGVAYVVFEDLGLGPYGDRLPQFAFEVLRQAGGGGVSPRLEHLARAVTLIPGSGEFVYGTTPVDEHLGWGRLRSQNAHVARAQTDLIAALDDLAVRLPNVTRVLLVVSWFGTDLRAGLCRLEPGVETDLKETEPQVWSVAGQTRGTARVVSSLDGRPAYGGTPSDASVIEAITELKARGLQVGLYPFVLMDIPPASGLPDPSGVGEQPPFPWRGRITCDPAPGAPVTVDASAAAGAKVAAFVGTAAASDYAVVGGLPVYSGPSEWTLRRMILHYAALAKAAGGVDSFVIGSEFVGLSTVRSARGIYPLGPALGSLAAEARALLGPTTKITYAADWTEYGAHVPLDGSGDVGFPLDALWSHPAIDAVGIDWYAPLSDWRDGAGHLDAGLASDDADPDYLAARIAGGEGFDWYYASASDRAAQIRTPIGDGLPHGETWMFRQKDLVGWWSNAHYPRTAGVRDGAPTAWTPQGKPIWFTELGCPAVDKGANQPNVFYDPKSSESAVPHSSSGARDDLIQRRLLEAHLGHWTAGEPGNPTSSVYGGAMLDADRIHLWTWDARPYPEFPARLDIWADGDNWRLGHWLSGRGGIAPIGDVIGDLSARVGLAIASDAGVGALAAGLVIEGPTSVRAALEPLAALFGFDLVDRAEGVIALPRAAPGAIDLSAENFAEADGAETDGSVRITRAAAGTVPFDVRVRFLDDAAEARPAAALARGVGAGPGGLLDVGADVLLDHDRAGAIAARLLAESEAARETAEVRVGPAAAAIEPGDAVRLPGDPLPWRVVRVEEGLAQSLTLVRALEAGPVARTGASPGAEPAPARPGRPYAVVFDAPMRPGETERGGPLVAATGEPWTAAVEVAVGLDAGSASARARLVRAARIASLLAPLGAGPVGVWDEAGVIDLEGPGLGLASGPEAAVLDGANLAAIEDVDGAWEIVQFQSAVLIAPDCWRLSRLLRGLAGSAAAAHPIGARVVILDEAVERIGLLDAERGLALTYVFTPAGGVAAEASLSSSALDLSPLSPVHLTARRTGDGIALSWVRRGRIDADIWERADIPLGEDLELYDVEVLRAGSVVWSAEAPSPAALFPAASETSLFPEAPLDVIEVRVAQRSTVVGHGRARTAVLEVAPV